MAAPKTLYTVVVTNDDKILNQHFTNWSKANEYAIRAEKMGYKVDFRGGLALNSSLDEAMTTLEMFMR